MQPRAPHQAHDFAVAGLVRMDRAGAVFAKNIRFYQVGRYPGPIADANFVKNLRFCQVGCGPDLSGGQTSPV